MSRKIKKILARISATVSEYYKMIFHSAAENHLRLSRNNEKRFRSFSQLKRYQKKMRRLGIGLIIALVFLVAGIVVGPILFPHVNESEVYIPNGKGDILLGNISKNQVTIVFKTLDAANANKPLATSAVVEASEDPEFTAFSQKTDPDGYAVTHIIPVSGLTEGKIYYFRITATDASTPAHSKVVTSWGDGGDPIKAYTTGDLAASCVLQTTADDMRNAQVAHDTDALAEKNETTTAPSSELTEGTAGADSQRDAEDAKDGSLRISNVQSENHLYTSAKVQTIISWTTNIPASTALVYREGNEGDSKQVERDTGGQTKHLVVMTTLKPGTTYYFSVKSVGPDGKTALSEEHSLLTPRAQRSVLQQVVDNFKQLLKQMSPIK